MKVKISILVGIVSLLFGGLIIISCLETVDLPYIGGGGSGSGSSTGTESGTNTGTGTGTGGGGGGLEPCQFPDVWKVPNNADLILHVDLRDEENSGTPCSIDDGLIKNYTEHSITRSPTGSVFNASSYISFSGPQLEDGAVFMVIKNNPNPMYDGQGFFDFAQKESDIMYWNEIAAYIDNTRGGKFAYSLYGADCGGFLPGNGGIGLDDQNGDIYAGAYIIAQYNWLLSNSPDKLQYAIKILGDTLNPAEDKVKSTQLVDEKVPHTTESRDFGCPEYVDLPYADLKNAYFGRNLADSQPYPLATEVIAIFLYKTSQTIEGASGE